MLKFSIKKNYLFICCLIFFTACSERTQEDTGSSTSESKKEKIEIKAPKKTDFSNYKVATETGVSFIISEDKISSRLSNISINGEGFEYAQELKLVETDPLESVLLADLNKDGFKEIYLITRSVGSGSYGKIYGFSSYGDKSYGEIYVRDFNTFKEGIPEGYFGHNSIYILENQLVNTFPIYIEEDSIFKPTSEEASLYYELQAGESGFILEAKQIQNK